MIKINLDNSIEMVQGDTAYLNVNIQDNINNYKFKKGDTLNFTLKKDIKDISPALTLQTSTYNKFVFYFAPSDTKFLNAGDYYYQISLVSVDGTMYTIIPINKFILIPNLAVGGKDNESNL